MQVIIPPVPPTFPGAPITEFIYNCDLGALTPGDYYAIGDNSSDNALKGFENTVVQFDGTDLIYNIVPDGSKVTIAGVEHIYSPLNGFSPNIAFNIGEDGGAAGGGGGGGGGTPPADIAAGIDLSADIDTMITLLQAIDTNTDGIEVRLDAGNISIANVDVNTDQIETILGDALSAAGDLDVIGQLRQIEENTDGVEGLLTTIDTDTGNIATDTSAIATDIAAIEVDVAALEVLVTNIDTNIGTLAGVTQESRGAGAVDAQTIRTTLETGQFDELTNILEGKNATAIVDGNVTATGTAAVPLALAADADTLEFYIENKSSTDNLYIRNNGTATVALSITLLPNSSFVFGGYEAQQAISVLTDGGSVTVYYKRANAV